MSELSEYEKQVLAREIAADNYDNVWPHRTSYGELPRESFISGWDAAMEYVNGQTKLVKSSESE